MSFVPPNIERQRLPARGILLGAGIALAVVGLAVSLWTGMGFLQLIGLFRGGTTVINVNQPTVVRQIQQLQRLETVSYTMDKIISGERDNAYLPKFLAGDRLLLVVHGDVIAGVDLGKSAAGGCVRARADDFTADSRRRKYLRRESIMRGRACIHATQGFFRLRIRIWKAKSAKKQNGSCSRPRCRMAC